MDRSLSFGSAPGDWNALFALAFASASSSTWPCRPGQLAGSLCKRHAVTGQARLPQLGGGWFQVLFHSPHGVLFTFPSRYLCAIGRQRVFSLGGWALRIQTGFHVSRPTWAPDCRSAVYAHGAVTLYGAFFQRLALAASRRCLRARNPGRQASRFGLFRVRSPLLAESLLFSSPPGTEMFHFPGYRLPGLFHSAGNDALLRGAGLLHSEIRGSEAACAYPRLIAACHVLHRLLSPRHPPSARTAWPPETTGAPGGAPCKAGGA